MHATNPEVTVTSLAETKTGAHAALASELVVAPTFSYGEVVLYGVAAMLAIVAPLFLVQLVQEYNVPFIRLMDEIYHPIILLQLFTFTAAAMLTLALLWNVWRQRDTDLRAQLPFLLGILVSFHVLALMRHHGARSWDYACYERAAQAIVAGQNPYGDCYIYVPTPAQALAGVHQLGIWSVNRLGLTAVNSPQALWDLVFYLYQSAQLVLVSLAFLLCHRLAVTLGIERIKGAGLVTLLFLINNPLLATLTHNQVNLWVLNIMLAAMLWLPRHPLLSGLLVALGGHIKLYPLVLLLPWTLQRRWRAVIGAGIGIIGIFLLQTGGGRHVQMWSQFLDFADNFPRGTFFRDNSLHSLVYNTLGHLKWLLRGGDYSGDYAVNEQSIRLVVLTVLVLLGLFYLLRFVQREAAQATDAPTTSVSQSLLADKSRVITADTAQFGHAFDAIVLALVASPVVWEHHYLLAMPLVIGAVAWAKTERQLWLIGASVFSIFVLPTFDIFPFSYHRLGGLLLLAATVSPKANLHGATRFVRGRYKVSSV